MKKRTKFILVIVFVLLPGCSRDYGMRKVEEWIRSEYPDVRHYSADSLVNWIATPSRVPPVLFDVREENEYEISHLQGAYRLQPGREDLSPLDSLGLDRAIVLYCSIGWRSSKMARRLQERGFTNVLNLEGSIFRWANKGQPVFRGNSRVRDVHPYDIIRQPLLTPGLATYKPRD